MTTSVDLVLVRDMLADALKTVESVDGTVIADNTLGNKPVEARLNRELLNLVDVLLLASTFVKNEYWSGKGLMAYDF